MANNHKKRCSKPLPIKEIKIETAMTYHFAPLMPAIMKQWKTSGAT